MKSLLVLWGNVTSSSLDAHTATQWITDNADLSLMRASGGRWVNHSLVLLFFKKDMCALPVLISSLLYNSSRRCTPILIINSVRSTEDMSRSSLLIWSSIWVDGISYLTCNEPIKMPSPIPFKGQLHSNHFGQLLCVWGFSQEENKPEIRLCNHIGYWNSYEMFCVSNEEGGVAQLEVRGSIPSLF